jgi:hypothetical protein
LEKLLGNGQREFSSKGIYAYWDPESHELLYLGLASNLFERFAQHNGLVAHHGGNKTKEIDAYFAEGRALGLTVLIQSMAIAVLEEVGEIDFTLGASSRDLIAVGEGQLIEMHKLVYGRRPPWNRTGGSKQGQRWATAASALLEVLAGSRQSLFAAREPLRTLTSNFKLMFFESTIHAARLRAVQEAHDLNLPMPSDPAGKQAKIEKILMLRDGSLVQDLDSTDADIRSWLERLADPRHWEGEAATWRQKFKGIELDMRGKQVLELLESYMEDAVPAAHRQATEEILRTGYLDREPLRDL